MRLASLARLVSFALPLALAPLVLAPVASAQAPPAAPPSVVVAEGESFVPAGEGWRVTHQDDSYGSHTYGGMWMSQGGCPAAPASSSGAVATRRVTIPQAGAYRVWSKYQAPPYFQYLHKIEILQGGKTVYEHVYGKSGANRVWSFSGESDELWWPWGVDHDAAEAPERLATLAAGPAEIRLSTLPQTEPAGDRYVDFVLLTTNPATDYQGFKPYKVGSPFALEALAATRLYCRFQNAAGQPARLKLSRGGHFQPNYGGATHSFPEADVPAGGWSAWFDIGPFCRLVHDEGLKCELPAEGAFRLQFARDAAGKDLVGDASVTSGEWVVVPIDITWKKTARVRSSREHALALIEQAKGWRTAGSGAKPKEILFFGSFNGTADWVSDFKHALGYNTGLPEKYPHSQSEGLHGHLYNEKMIRDFAAKHPHKERLRFISFGDEISLGKINFKDPQNQEKFRAWLAAQKLTKQQLGVAPQEATLAETGDPRLAWYANQFNEQERFADFRARTEVARDALGPQVLTGANYSPHHLALYYGPVYQWVDIFKHGGMSMFWAEDYIFSVPEAPQIISWSLAEARCGVKYRQQPIHYYIMPHAPGQTPGNLRRNTLAALGYGARHIDNFWVAPAETFTENYVSWNYPDNFRTIHEAIFDTAEAEPLLAGSTLRHGRVALVLSKATDYHESRLMVDKEQDFFARRCHNAPAKLNQIICRKDQQMLYLALTHAQHTVDLITEDDIVERDELRQYDVVYFAGEWIDNRTLPKLEAWIQAGGVLYATAGCGRLNQYGEPEPGMLKLLGLSGTRETKQVAILRTLLELPLLPPVDTITLGDAKIPAVGLKQTLLPAGAQVLGTWSDGGAAVTVRELGKGKAFAVGTLAGNTYMKTGVPVKPYARGGNRQGDHPENFDPAATRLVRLGLEAREPAKQAWCSTPLVETIVRDSPQGTLVTLLNWTNAPLKGATVSVRLPAPPRSVRSVALQKDLPAESSKGTVSFTLDLDAADFVLLKK